MLVEESDAAFAKAPEIDKIHGSWPVCASAERTEGVRYLEAYLEGTRHVQQSKLASTSIDDGSQIHEQR